MSKRMLILILAAVLMAVALWAGTSALATTGPSQAALRSMTPVDVTGAYYTWYLEMLADEVLCHPLLDGVYRTSPYLSSALIAALDARIQEHCAVSVAFEPFLCSSAITPTRISASLISMDDEAAHVLVRGAFLTESSVRETRALADITLVREEGRWVIDAVACR